MPVNLETAGDFDPIRRKLPDQRRIERACADRRIKETHGRFNRQKLPCIGQHVRGKPGWRSELSEFVTFGLALFGIKGGLKSQAAILDRHQRIHDLHPKLREIVDTVFPHPIDTLSGFVTEITAVEIPAQEQHEAHTLPVCMA